MNSTSPTEVAARLQAIHALYPQVRAIVQRWDSNNGMCLLGDHRDDLVQMISDAILAERERCAGIAEHWFDKRWPDGSYTGHAKGIAAAIRALPSEGEN